MKGFIFYICYSTLCMKQLCLIICTLCLVQFANAQKNFEGTVTYRLHSGAGDKKDAELKVLFGVRKIKLLFKEDVEYNKEALIIFVDSAMAYTVDFSDKTYKRRALNLATPPKKTENKIIAGYSTISYQPNTNNGLGDLLGGYMGASSAVYYLADSLFYDIPDIYAGTKELIMIQQHKIALGAEVELRFRDYGITDDSVSKKINLVTAEAIEVKPMAIAETEFLIPADFTVKKDMVYPPAEEPAAAIDTVAAPVPAKKSVKKKSAKPASPKSKSTPKAARRKE